MNLLKDKYSLLIFDWDGTLMDSTARIVSSMQAAADILALPIPDEQIVKSSIGLSMQGVMQRVFPDIDPQKETAFFNAYRQQYVEENPTPSPLFPGTLDLLYWLRSQKVLLTVATGKARHGLSRVLAASELNDFFDFSICADEAKSKPDPEMIYRLLEQSNTQPAQALMLGDSIHDLKMAQTAKVDAIGVSGGACSADELNQYSPIAVLPSVCDLKSWFLE